MFEDVIKDQSGQLWEKVKEEEKEGPYVDINGSHAGELARLTAWLLSTDRYNSVYGNPVDQVIHTIALLEAQIDELADYLLKNFGEDIKEGSAVENIIRLMKLYSYRTK